MTTDKEIFVRSLTVKPFSGTSYAKNARCFSTASGAEACVVCGKKVSTPWPYFVVVVDGGAGYGPEDADENDPGFLGCFPVGEDCRRRYMTDSTTRPYTFEVAIKAATLAEAEQRMADLHPDDEVTFRSVW